MMKKQRKTWGKLILRTSISSVPIPILGNLVNLILFGLSDIKRSDKLDEIIEHYEVNIQEELKNRLGIHENYRFNDSILKKIAKITRLGLYKKHINQLLLSEFKGREDPYERYWIYLALGEVNANYKKLISDIGSPTLLTITSQANLTTATLRNDILPTLEGLEILEKASSDALEHPYLGIINSISQDSPISISLTGFKEAVDLVLEWVIPWRRKNAERLAALKLKQQEIELEKSQIENQQREIDLARSKLDLAEHLLSSIDPNGTLSERNRKRLLQQYVLGIDQLCKTSIEFKAISSRHKNDNFQYER